MALAPPVRCCPIVNRKRGAPLAASLYERRGAWANRGDWQPVGCPRESGCGVPGLKPGDRVGLQRCAVALRRLVFLLLHVLRPASRLPCLCLAYRP